MACGGDTEINDVARMLRALQAAGYLLVFISYRSESTRALSKAWLWDHGFEVADQDLVLRPGDRGQPAHEFKLEKIRQLEQERGLKFIFAIEDDLPVCQHLRAHDIPCYQVRDWKNPMPSEAVEMPTYHAADSEALSKLVSLAQNDLTEGRVFTVEEAKDRLKQRRQ